MLSCRTSSSALSEDICSHLSSCLADVNCGLYLKVTYLEYGHISVPICRFWYAVINTSRIVFYYVFGSYVRGLLY